MPELWTALFHRQASAKEVETVRAPTIRSPDKYQGPPQWATRAKIAVILWAVVMALH